ncbi:hypothetical protein NDU88_006931 [Pleurodeles waltl]|uniref:Uncharacterized protein n=1 Tax=Pleurodeles waltl TaxID=8319 RepID=A0AAV7NVX0_PLEWA|nr:hypothetical protein NDU88_006931 [Pleurodeles waltl]
MSGPERTGRSSVPKLRPIDSTRIPSAVKSRKCDVSRAIYTDVKEGTSLDTRYHGGGLMELTLQGILKNPEQKNQRVTGFEIGLTLAFFCLLMGITTKRRKKHSFSAQQ